MAIKRITQLDQETLAQLVAIWLKTNQEAHPFIASDYWVKNELMVKNQLPQATLFVSFDGAEVTGFLGLQDAYVAGLFIKKAHQGSGLGKALLEAAKKESSTLTLAVYEKNERAMQFYLSQGFQLVKVQLDEETGEKEAILEWHRA
ncbi:GNAT family N-acetyltransferase [Candidatus Enterococcus huntleyi]|uniref:GNAT family N-acetyltransferase n=1 Tax=Candidatus Enterococcus huntleyi TaxID=1857217 RepID=UPI003075DC7F